METNAIRITPNVARVLRAFLEDPTGHHYGMQLMKEARLTSGTLYPILARLEKAQWIEGQVEEINPQAEGRPARRYYAMTAEGAREAHLALARLSAEFQPPAQSRWLPGIQPEGI